jgi:hypothetical protein
LIFVEREKSRIITLPLNLKLGQRILNKCFPKSLAVACSKRFNHFHGEKPRHDNKRKRINGVVASLAWRR